MSQTAISIEQLKDLCDRLWDLKLAKEEAEDVVSRIQGDYNLIRDQLKELFSTYDLDRFDTEECTINRIYKSSVKVPKDPADREAFFNWLKEKGTFEDLITIGSSDLNDLYCEEEERALERGEIDFKIPGLTATVYEQLRVNKKNRRKRK